MNEVGTPRPRSIRVHLVDDHEVVREGLRELLESNGDIEVVGESGSAAEAAAAILALRPDVAILDVKLPDGSGIDLCRTICGQNPTVQDAPTQASRVAVIILTSYDDDETVLSAFLAGASGCLVKQIREHGLVESVREAAAGRSIRGAAGRRTPTAASSPDRLDVSHSHLLTTEERDVLDCLAEGMTAWQIGPALLIADNAVQRCFSSLVAKLGLRATPASMTPVERREGFGHQALSPGEGLLDVG